VVLVSWCGVPPHKLQPERVLRRDWAGVPAFDQGRVYALPEAFLGRPGPRLAEGVARIRELLRATP
jgi:iron complex transport system substrate-binding protein